MKQLLFLVVILCCSNSFSQSKKKQIEALNYRIDSLNRVMQMERTENSQKISDLNTKVNQLNGEISNLEDQIKRKQETIEVKEKELILQQGQLNAQLEIVQTKNREIGNLQMALNSKSDSLKIITAELAKLKPSVKTIPSPSVTDTSTSNVVNTGSFKSVTIGTQVWMKENLNVSTFRNGDPIIEAKTMYEWGQACVARKPCWCYYDFDSKNGEKYGKMYNMYAVADPRGLAPVGWHISTDREWVVLEKSVNKQQKKLKSTSGWTSYSWGGDWIPCSNCKNWNAEYRSQRRCDVCKNTRTNGKRTPRIEYTGNGTNSTGFNSLPGGKFSSTHFHEIGEGIHYWTIATFMEFEDKDELNDVYNDQHYGYAILDKFNLNEGFKHYPFEPIKYNSGADFGEGMYVRCIKD